MAVISQDDEDRIREEEFYDELGSLLRDMRTKENDYTRQDVADGTGFSVDQIQRFEKGHGITAYAISKLADFYQEPYETFFLVENIPTGQVKLTDRTGLSEASIKWLEKMNRENREIVKIINRLFSDEAVANTVFGAFYAYARLSIPSITETKRGRANKTYYSVSKNLLDESSLLKYALSSCIFEALEEVRKTAKLRKDWESTPEVKAAFERIQESMRAIRSRQDERYAGDSKS